MQAHKQKFVYQSIWIKAFAKGLICKIEANYKQKLLLKQRVKYLIV